MLMTATGAEIVLQRLIRVDQDFLVALARLSGCTDQAKVLVVPYSQLTYLSFTNKLSDEQINGLLTQQGEELPPLARTPMAAAPSGNATAAASGKEPAAASTAAAPGQSVSPSVDTPLPVNAGDRLPSRPNAKVSPPSKSILLARLRQRLAEDISKQPRT
jgi:hypothetical protein